VDFLVLAYLAAAALGALVLAQALGARPVACAGTGLAFALSGYSASMTGNLVFLAGLSTLPWLVAAARSAGEGGRFGPVLTAAATACAFLSGDVQVTLLGVALGALLAADAGGPRGVARAAAGVVVGFLLAGVQVLATEELLSLSSRATGLDEFDRTRWPLAPGRILEWIVPGLFRGPLGERPIDAAGALIEEPFASSVYLGAPLLVAAALGAFRPAGEPGRRTGWLLAAAAGVLLWLALGPAAGARQLLEWVPVWSQFRYPEKLMAPLGLVLCALAARGVAGFASARLPRRMGLALAALALGAATALVVAHAAPAAMEALGVRLLGAQGAFYRANLVAALPHRSC
jgi:hypothetical protein